MITSIRDNLYQERVKQNMKKINQRIAIPLNLDTAKIIEIGVGINGNENIFKKSVQGSFAQKKNRTTNSQQKSLLSENDIQSKNFFTGLGQAQSTKNFFNFFANAQKNLKKQSKQKAFTYYIIHTYQGPVKQVLQNPKINQTILKFFQKKQLTQCFDIYGTHFVSQIIYGACFYGKITMQFKNNQNSNNQAGKIKLQLDKIISDFQVKGEIGAGQNSFLSSYKIDCQLLVFGFQVNQNVRTIKQLLQAHQQFINEIKKKKNPTFPLLAICLPWINQMQDQKISSKYTAYIQQEDLDTGQVFKQFSQKLTQDQSKQQIENLAQSIIEKYKIKTNVKNFFSKYINYVWQSRVMTPTGSKILNYGGKTTYFISIAIKNGWIASNKSIAKSITRQLGEDASQIMTALISQTTSSSITKATQSGTYTVMNVLKQTSPLQHLSNKIGIVVQIGCFAVQTCYNFYQLCKGRINLKMFLKLTACSFLSGAASLGVGAIGSWVGAALGTCLGGPGLGTAIGAFVGGVIGGIIGGVSVQLGFWALFDKQLDKVSIPAEAKGRQSEFTYQQSLNYLGLRPNVSTQGIQAVFRQQMRKYHPDKIIKECKNKNYSKEQIQKKREQFRAKTILLIQCRQIIKQYRRVKQEE